MVDILSWWCYTINTETLTNHREEPKIPNWCSNHIEVRGSDPAEIERLADAFDAEQFCNAVVPVPKGVDAYNFCVENWGTKWDVDPYEACDRHDDGLGFSGSFDSAWSPPIAIAETLREYGFEVVLRYHESGMAFVGKWDDGFDECVDYGGIPAKQIRQSIGDDLDDFFGITEMIEYYEDDEEDLSQWIREGVDARENV